MKKKPVGKQLIDWGEKEISKMLQIAVFRIRAYLIFLGSMSNSECKEDEIVTQIWDKI